jgi:hypothetical protein
MKSASRPQATATKERFDTLRYVERPIAYPSLIREERHEQLENWREAQGNGTHSLLV